MTKEEWKELASDNISEKRYNELIKKTHSEEEHPEWFEDHWCECLLCRSYID